MKVVSRFIVVSFLTVGLSSTALADVAPKPTPKTGKLDVHFQLRSYFSAGGVSAGIGGNAENKVNTPTPYKGKAKPGSRVRLLVSPPDATSRWGAFAGRTIQVVNTGRRAVIFDAQDSLLDIVHEAKNSAGVWTKIEYMPQSWCGNSYHTLSLPGKSKWSFTAPVYTGDTPVKMRVRIVTQSGVVRSEVFDGNINADQFDVAKKQGHQATNLMDPYID
ncbi:MAG: hypothetical protein JKY56_13655 [Kofleriaceae bacterium]|nr:hypothetical protein [Kofleriaceae bacterium]